VSLLNNILTWATTDLAPWQRDAVRRLFQKEVLDHQDYDELYAMLRAAHGLPDPQNWQPVPLAQEHLPAHVMNATPVVLRAMRDLKHVNRIASGQKLEFAPSGMTVIYGGNGSGKSGYSRVLKRACRARDLSEIVHPDAFDAKAAASVPEAGFDVEISGKASSLQWRRDNPPPDELSTIAVFDGKCARAYLDTEQDVAYLPYGLDIVENLGRRVLPELTQRLNSEIGMVNTDTSPFADLLGDTAVGKIITSLSAATDSQKVTTLATLTDDETNRLTALDKTLAESDPKTKAKALRLSAQRIDGLISRIDSANAWVNDAAIAKIVAYDAEAEAAFKAEAVAATNFRAGEPLLSGTGEQVWKNLFEAARRFSTEIAYSGKPFPYVGAGAQCPLCQQLFDQEVVKRMQRFENFVKQDTAKVAAEKRAQREKAEEKISKVSLEFGLDAATTEELKQLNAILLQTAQDFEKKVEARRAWILVTLKTHSWNCVPVLDGDPRTGLKLLSVNIITQATDLEKASNEEQKKLLETERTELRARTSLSPRLKSVLDIIQRMQIKAKLTKCKDDLKTKAISDKAKEFASQAVTVALKNALDTEFKALGVGHIKTKLNPRVDQVKMKHKLVLDLPVTKKLDEILSEGEQRAIAIGSFLAELHLGGHQGGIVFDDPVSSLDHHRRMDVARRFVEEAKKRQVIVLTHDTVFLSELRGEISRQNVPHFIHHLEWRDGFPGYISAGLPWEHKSYEDRIDKLEKVQREMNKNWPVYPNEEDRARMTQQYSLLRATIERAVQDIVLNGIVRRYDQYVRVENLKGVVGFEQVEHDEILRLYRVCHDIVNAHDPSSAKNASVPSAQQLGNDIEALKTTVNQIKDKRKKGLVVAGS
jgi:energy-coupling factor transporter ATP-binding protein EcfA2